MISLYLVVTQIKVPPENHYKPLHIAFKKVNQ